MMKKTLIAMAALAATSVFAQSTVTLSGNLDVAASNSTGTQLVGKGTTFATTTGTSSTSVLRFIAVEDLGGGLKATAQYNFDPRGTVNDNAAPTRDEAFVGISGGFGNVRLGAPNSIGLLAYLAASPLGTGIGSGFGLVNAKAVQIRYNRSVVYNSPNMSGFSASVHYAPGNDLSGATAIPNARQATELGLNYAQGPITVAFANVGQAAQVNGTAGVRTSGNTLSANFKLGADTTLYASVNNGDSLASATKVATKGSLVAVRQNMGAIALIAQYTQQTTGGVKANLTGLRADYNLSKTAAVYAGYEKWDTGAAYKASASTGDRTTVAMGLRKSF